MNTNATSSQLISWWEMLKVVQWHVRWVGTVVYRRNVGMVGKMKYLYLLFFLCLTDLADTIFFKILATKMNWAMVAPGQIKCLTAISGGTQRTIWGFCLWGTWTNWGAVWCSLKVNLKFISRYFSVLMLLYTVSSCFLSQILIVDA
jgi:hypothetical protein